MTQIWTGFYTQTIWPTSGRSEQKACQRGMKERGDEFELNLTRGPERTWDKCIGSS